MSQFSRAHKQLISKKIIGINTISLLIIVIISPGLSVGDTQSGISSPSSITRDSIKIEIIETAPTSMDDPNIRNVSEVWPGLFENAENTIYLEAPYINYYSSGTLAFVYTKLQEVARDGVKVRILTNELDNDLSYLAAESNIEVLEPSNSELDIHAKYFVIDNRIAFVGSQNWSYTATESNHEIGLLIEGKQIANAYTYIFNSGWSAVENENVGGEYWETDWLYPVASGPEMPSEARPTLNVLENLINSAESKIQVFIYVISTGSGADQLVDALESAAERGVEVRVMTGAAYYPDLWPEEDLGSLDFSEVLGELDNVEGISVKTVYLGEWTWSHQKVIITDGESAYVGSANWTSSSMYGRREVGAVVNDSTLASALNESFDVYWNSEYSKSVGGGDSGFHNSIYVIIVAISIVIGVIVVVWAWRTIRSRKLKRMQRAGEDWSRY